MTAINASTGQPIKIVQADQIGFNGLKAEDFLKLLLEQLKNQDPTKPMSNEEMLNQISQIRSLQSNLELSTSLKNLGTSQGISAGSSFLGKEVAGIDAENKLVQGVVDRVLFREGKVILGVGEQELPVENLEGVALPVAAA